MARISERMLALGTAPSEIRDAFSFARQRAAEVGGWLDAGPSAGGWRVEATLPLTAGPEGGE